MSALRPSPAMTGFVTDQIDSMETYDKIQEMKSKNFKLKGCLFLENGKMHLIFHAKSDDTKVYNLVIKRFRMRSFSSHQ